MEDADARIDVALTVLSARHIFGEGWDGVVVVPVGFVDVDGGSGASGFGDLQLGFGYELGALWGLDGWEPTLRVGLTLELPTGLEARSETTDGLAEQIQIGQGAYALSLDLTFTQFVSQSWALMVPARVRQPVTTSARGVQFGTQVSYGLSVLYLPTDWLLLNAGLEGFWRDSSESPDSGTNINSGGHTLSTQLLARFSLSDSLSLGLRTSVPILQSVGGEQVTQTFSVGGFVGLTFGGSHNEEEEEDGHDHGGDHNHGGGHDEHDHGGGHDDHHDDGGGHDEHDGHNHSDGHDDHGGDHDSHEHGAAGQFRDIVPADLTELLVARRPGRVTVIDFWAAWCVPCKAITRLLREEARAGRVDVLRVDVDALSEEAQDAFFPQGSMVLPTVWIYGPDGALIQSLEATHEQAVRDALP